MPTLTINSEHASLIAYALQSAQASFLSFASALDDAKHGQNAGRLYREWASTLADYRETLIKKGS